MKKVLLPVIGLFFLIPLGLFGMGAFKHNEGMESSDSAIDNPSKPLISAPLASVDVESLVFTHSGLPGFRFDYPSDWIITVKGPDTEVQSLGILFPNGNCGLGCYRIIVNQGDISLNILFHQTYGDGFPPMCSNQAKNVSIGRSWFRIMHSMGIYYSQSIKTDRDTSKDPTIRYWANGAIGDEWSYLPDTTYVFCDEQQEPYLSASSEVVEEGVLGLYAPVILGEPSTEQLEQIDLMVQSIEGIQ